MRYRRALLQASQAHYLRGHELYESAKGNKTILESSVAEYQQALNYDPTNQMAAMEMENALKMLKKIQEKERQEKSALVKMKKEVEQKYPLIAVLKPSSKTKIDLKFSEESLKNIITTLAKIAGINVIFDKDIRDDKFSIEFHNVTFREALEQILAANTLFYKIIDENTIFISVDNPQKRRQYEEQVVKTFYLSNAELNDVVNLVRNVTQIQKIATNPQLNAITIKDTPERVAIAQKIIEANDKAKSEVLLNVEILEVNKTVAKKYGIDLNPLYEVTQQLDASGTPGVLRGHQFKYIDAADWSFTIPTITYRLLRTDSHTKVLARPQIRASEGKQVQVRLGNRIPIPITTFTSITTTPQTPQPGLVSPITNYQQQDVGINIDVTPRVHHNREVTLDIRFELTSIASQGRTLNEPPTIGNRTINTTIRLMDGETNLLAGLLREDERRSLRGFPGIEKIPLLRAIFAANEENIEQTDVIFTITPQIIRMPNITEEDLQPLWVGTEDQPKLKTPPPVSIFETEEGEEKAEEEGEAITPPAEEKAIPEEKKEEAKESETVSKPVETQPEPQKKEVESAKPETKTVETKPTISEEKQTPLPQEHKEAPPTTPPQKEKPTEPPKKESQKPKASIVTGSITAPPIAKIGDDIIVKISLDYILEITTINLSLSFEPELMQLKEVREGELLEVSPNTSMSSSLNLIDKTLSIQIATDFEDAGITGQGVLLYLQFSAVGSGTVQLSIPASQFVNKYNENLPGQFAVTSLVIQE
jgi:general secretion pathway protein D